MSSNDLELGGGLKLRHLLRKGYTGYFEGRTFHILHGNAEVKSFSDSQGKILTQLRQKRAMTPSQIAEAVGATPAAVIYNLKGLISAGTVERHALPGGTVFYVLCWDVNVGLPPSLREKVQRDVTEMGGWSTLAEIPMNTLRTRFSYLSEDELLELMRYLVSGEK